MKKLHLNFKYGEKGAGKTVHPYWVCSICNKVSQGFGNNPQPVKRNVESRCCDDCNNTIVVPRRFREARKEIN